MESICVFCGSSVGKRPEYSETARSFGKLIASRDITLVYGGGNIGLMREVADGALEAGGKVIGVMPKLIVDKEIAHNSLHELKIVNTMH